MSKVGKDLYNHQELYENGLNRFKRGLWCRKGYIHLKGKEYKLRMSITNRNFIIDFLYDCEIGKTGIKGRSKKAISKGRCYKYLQQLIRLNDYFRKDFDKIDNSDTERFINDLNTDKFCKSGGKPLSEVTKVGYKITVIKFMKWLYKSKQPPAICNWFDLTAKDKPVYVPSFKDINKVIDSKTTSLRNRFIIRVLSDSGARLSEFALSQLQDFSKFTSSKDRNDYYKFTIHDQNSKTYGRTIILKYSTKIIDEWLKRHPLNGMYPKRTPIKPKTHSPNNQDNRVFTFLDEKLLKQLEKYAEDYKIKKSQVLRTALVSYLRSNGYDKDVEQTRRL